MQTYTNIEIEQAQLRSKNLMISKFIFRTNFSIPVHPTITMIKARENKHLHRMTCWNPDYSNFGFGDLLL